MLCEGLDDILSLQYLDSFRVGLCNESNFPLILLGGISIVILKEHQHQHLWVGHSVPDKVSDFAGFVSRFQFN